MSIRESVEAAVERLEQLHVLQEHYPTFDDFLPDVIEGLMGFVCTDVQMDIGRYLEEGPLYSMIQAQRGQAKTTITAAYAVWCLIHNPSFRILIISSGGTMAKEISNWIIQIINGMDELECMRPDRSAGDRASVEAFDVHYTLKGPEKSPSVACIGITSNMQGKRADLLIADDIESSKNALTETQRANLLHLTLDFTSICSVGKIVYLGTPQSIDSIYNTLPGRGYTIRIWPGRYPTEKEEKNYGGNLAPMLQTRMQMDPSLRTGGGPTGSRGKPVDPVLLGEDILCKKEIDQGSAYFQLQHMLDTRLSDAERFPLKLSKIMFMSIPAKRAPVIINRIADPTLQIHAPTGSPLKEPMYRIAGYEGEFVEFTSTHMYIDPAGGGQNGDETAYAISRFIGSNVYIVDFGGIPGGIEDEKLDALCDIINEWKPHTVEVEQNFGHGMFGQVLRKKLLEKKKDGYWQINIEDVYETGQKELRIIDTLEPVIGSSSLIIEESLIEKDWNACIKYGTAKAPTYSLFLQLSRITRDRGALTHDDRLDALAGTVRFWKDQMDQDKEETAQRAAEQAFQDMIRNPLGSGRSLYQTAPISMNAFDKFTRR